MCAAIFKLKKTSFCTSTNCASAKSEINIFKLQISKREQKEKPH